MNDKHDFSGDELMLQLAAADPVDIQTIPGPEATSAQQLLEATISSDTDTGKGGEHIGNQISPDVKQQTSRRMQFTRSRTMLAGAAAAVLILFGGLLVLSPNNTPSAVAAVHSAAAEAADSDSGRITTTFALVGTLDAEDGTGLREERQAGRLDVEYSGSDVSFSLQADEQNSDSEFNASDLPFNEGRLVDDVLYTYDGNVWWSVDTDGLLGQIVADFVDPRVVLEKVQELTETVEVGETTIDGETVTHYQSVVDLGDESLSESGWLGFEAGSVDGEGELTVDLYVGSDGILNQLDLSGDVEEGTESGTFEVSMKFFDIGSDITIEAPADAVEIDIFGGLEGGLDGLADE